MADYPDLEESNRALRDRFARNPVIPNSTPAPDLPPDPGSGQNALFGGFSSASPATPSGGLGQSIDDRLAARIAARDAPVISAAASPASAAYRDPSRGRDVVPTAGNVFNATTAGGDTQSVQVPQRVIGQGSSYDPTQTQASLDSANARSRVFGAVAEQDARNAQQNVQAYNDRAVNRFDAGIKEREAQVERFKAQNSADVVLGNLTDRIIARKALGASADAADKVAADARTRAAAPVNPVGNIGAETLAAQDIASRAQIANQAGAESASRTALNQQQGVITVAQQKAELEKSNRINALGASIIGAKDPAARDKASKDLLSLLGKDKPDRYQVIHAAGGTRLGPDGFTQIKDPDNIVIVDKETGKRELVPMSAAQGQQAAPPANHIQALKQDPGKYRAQFEAKYGKGSADQYLQ